MSYSTVTPLHVNGGLQVIECSNCGTTLGDVRAVSTTPSGVRFFCKMEQGDKPEDSCFNQWRMRRH